jgi:hypothetical protein
MTDSAGRAWRRIGALMLAGALAVAGLWLAVGAGAKGGGSARAGAYPTYSYKTHIDNVKFGKLASTESNKVRFKFHSTYNDGSPLSDSPYWEHRCKLDGKHYKKCDSPKKYRHLHHGKHKFRVKLVWHYTDSKPIDESAPAKYRWKVK